MNARIEPFVLALTKTMETLAGPPLSLGSVEHGPAPSITADVSAQIDVAGEHRFAIVLTATEAAARELVRTLAGMETAFEDSITADTLGEVLNVVVGCAQKAGRFQFSIPVIEATRAHTVNVSRRRYYQRVVSRTAQGEIGLYLVGDAPREGDAS